LQADRPPLPISQKCPPATVADVAPAESDPIFKPSASVAGHDTSVWQARTAATSISSRKRDDL
jgi:hypothetical protein